MLFLVVFVFLLRSFVFLSSYLGKDENNGKHNKSCISVGNCHAIAENSSNDLIWGKKCFIKDERREELNVLLSPDRYHDAHPNIQHG